MCGGYAYGEQEPLEKCPYCGVECRADFVDIGIGFEQCGPYHCENCGASEIGPYNEPRELTEEEKTKHWYNPGSEPGSSANVIGGKIVTAEQMKKAYQDEFRHNPLWHDKKYVADWYKRTRQKK